MNNNIKQGVYPVYVNTNLLSNNCRIEENDWPLLCDYLLEKGIDNFTIDLSEEGIMVWINNHSFTEQACNEIERFFK